MGAQYAGDPTAFPVDFTIPDDGDLDEASTFNVAYEALGDRTAYLKSRLPYLESTSYTSSGSVTVPPKATHCFYEMCGGGGGGGGANIAAGSDRSDSPGGGGGGAILCAGIVEVIAAETLNYNIGAGGTAGAGGASATSGGSGGDTTLVRATGSVTLATARGAQGGAHGTSDNASAHTATVLATDEDGSASPVYRVSCGGNPVRGGIAETYRTFDKPISGRPRSTVPQAGGDGVSGRVTGGAGGSSPQGYAGGSGGGLGTTNSAYLGGSGGGGGGAGPYGVGANGGHGGDGNASGSGATGVTAGGSAGANTGAGGGGGGAPGGSSTTTGNGGAGGAGGSGFVKLTFLRASG